MAYKAVNIGRQSRFETSREKLLKHANVRLHFGTQVLGTYAKSASVAMTDEMGR